MSTFLKVALALLLTLPLGAYVLGTLVSAQTDMPTQRPAVVVKSTAPEESPSPSSSLSPTPDDSLDDDGEREDGKEDRDDDSRDEDDVQVVRPTPHDVDDGDRDHRDDRDDSDHSDDGTDDH